MCEQEIYIFFLGHYSLLRGATSRITHLKYSTTHFQVQPPSDIILNSSILVLPLWCFSILPKYIFCGLQLFQENFVRFSGGGYKQPRQPSFKSDFHECSYFICLHKCSGDFRLLTQASNRGILREENRHALFL